MESLVQEGLCFSRHWAVKSKMGRQGTELGASPVTELWDSGEGVGCGGPPVTGEYRRVMLQVVIQPPLSSP